MNIPLAKAYAIIDKERGKLLAEKKKLSPAALFHAKNIIKEKLDLLNNLKKEFSHLSDADQIPLGL